MRTRALLALGTAVALLAAAVVLALRPGMVLGVGEPELTYSLVRHAESSVIFPEVNRCGPPRAGVRTCEIVDAGGSGSATWRLRERDHGCWEARRVGGGTETPQPARASGCVTLRDYLRVGERLLG
jgi:hypothetical protein